MALNDISLPVRSRAGGQAKPLTRADEVDDVSGGLSMHAQAIVLRQAYQDT